jgi:hypothetical protein
MTADEARRLIEQHGSQRKAAQAAGVTRRAIRWAVERGDNTRPVAARRAVRASKPGRTVGRTLAEFRQTYDKETIVPSRVDAAVAALGDGWLYEVEFAKHAGVSLSDLGMFRDKYSRHVVSVREGRRVWFGNPKNAEEARRML